jgi:hypothetical protein
VVAGLVRVWRVVGTATAEVAAGTSVTGAAAVEVAGAAEEEATAEEAAGGAAPPAPIVKSTQDS